MAPQALKLCEMVRRFPHRAELEACIQARIVRICLSGSLLSSYCDDPTSFIPLLLFRSSMLQPEGLDWT